MRAPKNLSLHFQLDGGISADGIGFELPVRLAMHEQLLTLKYLSLVCFVNDISEIHTSLGRLIGRS